jgi:hypothetical protein
LPPVASGRRLPEDDPDYCQPNDQRPVDQTRLGQVLLMYLKRIGNEG